jgi:hypothetical protein
MADGPRRFYYSRFVQMNFVVFLTESKPNNPQISAKYTYFNKYFEIL